MKAILVIDMPNNCEECKIIYLQGHGESICDSGDWSKRPSWCPLKPLPEKKELANYLPFEDYSQQIRLMDFVNGWNACIEEITGETE